MQGRPLGVLIIDDSEETARAVVQALRDVEYIPEMLRVEEAETLLLALQDREWDVVIAAYMLRRFSGRMALSLVRKHAGETPFIWIDKALSYETAVAAMRAGADDFIADGDLRRLAPVVTRVLRETDVRREKQQIEKTLRASERRYRQLFEGAPIGIGIATTDGKIADANRAMLQMCGYTLEEFRAIDLTQTYLYPEERLSIFSELREKGAVRNREVLLKKKEGTIYRALLNVDMIEIDGKPMMQTTAREVAFPGLTDQATLRSVGEAALDALILMDSDGKIIFWNKAAQVMFGYTTEEVIGQDIHPLLTPEQYHGAAHSGMAVFRKTGTGPVIGRTVELEARRRDGSHFPIELSLSSLRLDNAWGAVGIARDITERKRNEKNLLQAKSQSEVAVRARKEFLSVMSHEIKTPLTGMLGFVQLLESMLQTIQIPEGEDARSFLKSIRDSGDGLMTLVNDILELARIESGMMETYWSSFSPASLLENVSGNFLFRIREKGLKFSMEIDPVLRATVAGDPRRFRQVLFNLIGNAVKFTEKGSVHIFLKRGENGLWIEVRDTGVGISEEAQRRLFTPFYQADQSASRRFNGSGLGLSIVRRFLDALGGTIQIQSTVGKGTAVLVEYPVLFRGDTLVDQVLREDPLPS